MQVGETLTATTSGIADGDGLANAIFSYQWLANDAVITGANDSSYVISDSARESALRVRVSFTDDNGFDESLTSRPVAVEDRPYELTASAVDGAVVLTWKPPVVFPYLHDYQILRNRPELGETGPLVYVDTGNDETTYTDTDVEPGVLYVYRVKAASFRVGKASEPVEIRTPAWTNIPATGAPTISGTAQVGETLTADTSGIADEDGLANAAFSFQWTRSDGSADADIQDATASTYTLTSDDEGKSMKVRVTFTDDTGNAETLTSEATAAVEARANNLATGVPTISGTLQVGETLTADTSGIADADGLSNATYSYQWLANDVDISGATGARYTLADSDEGKAIKLRVTFTDDARNEESLTSQATAAVEARANNLATGVPTISGTLQVGETLTADTSGIADADGLSNATFGFQWTRNDGSADADIQDATASTHTLTSDDEGKTIKVRVNFTDDARNEESLTSQATAAVEARANNLATGVPTISGTLQVGETLTADTSGIADADGLSNATFGFQWTRNDGSADADIQDATASTHTLTSDDEGKTIKVRVNFTDDARNEESLTSQATAAVEARANNLATDVPTISGTLQVGETLTADTSGIADADGLSNATYSYQWLANDVDISGATGARYTLADLDEGKAMKVRVSFTDDANNAETLTSDATAAVAAATKPNSPATGAPTVSGMARVGETLTADISGLADADGLESVTYVYQWLAERARHRDGYPRSNDVTKIKGATGSKYTLTASEEGKAIRVQVYFADDAANPETLRSEATALVEATAEEVVWESELTVGREPDIIPEALGYSVSGELGGTLSPDHFEIDGTVYDVQFLLHFAEGLWLGIDGELPVEFMLSVGDSTYQGSDSKLPVTGSDSGAYWWPLETPEWSADESVQVSLTIQPQEPMENRQKAPLTAHIRNIPSGHDGQSTFTFELRFGEETDPDFSYKTLRDHAFTVTGGSVVNARRLNKPSNIGWEITVKPDGNSEVTILLPATTDCAAQGAICTGDGRMLFNRIELTVAGPGG